MNFIKQLQADRAAAVKAQDATLQAIFEFRAFLASAKFTGVDSDGSRKDWISTGDVDRFLRDLTDTVNSGIELTADDLVGK